MERQKYLGKSILVNAMKLIQSERIMIMKKFKFLTLRPPAGVSRQLFFLWEAAMGRHKQKQIYSHRSATAMLYLRE